MLTRPNVQERSGGGGSGGDDLSPPSFGCCGISTSYSSHSHHAAGMSQAEKPSCLSSIKSQSLRETLQKSSSDNEKRRLTADMQKQVKGLNNDEDVAAAIAVPPPSPSPAAADSDELSKALEFMQAREDSIEKRKHEVRQKVQAKLSKVEVEARSLDNLRKELEGLEDPSKKEVAEIRKKIEAVEKELKPLKQLCEKKEKEFHDTVKQHEEKAKLKAELVSKLMEAVNKGETLRMKKLDDLIANFESMAAAEAEKNKTGPAATAAAAPPAAAAAPTSGTNTSSISPAPALV